MISKNAANVAINITQEFDRRRLVLTPSGPLAELVSSSCLTDVVAEGSDYLPDAEFIESMSRGYNEEGTSQHDQQLAVFGDEIAKPVAQHLNFAKNVVRPIISEFVNAVAADIEALPVDVQYSRNVVQVKLPAPLASAAFIGMVDEFKGVPYEPVNAYVNLGQKAGSEVIECLVTGASDTDAAIQAWAVQKGEAFFQRVWDSVFTDAPTPERFDSLIQDSIDGVDAAITVFLIAKRVYNEPPEGTGVSLVDYNQKLADLRNQAALRIDQGLESYNRAVRTGLLIQRVSDTDLWVNAEVYAKWMSEGGTPGVLFGSVMSGRPVRFVGDLNDKAEEFKALWEQTNSMLTAKARNNRFVNVKQILRERGEKIIGDNLAPIFGTTVPEGQEISKDLPGYQQAVKCLHEAVDIVREGEMKDLWMLGTRLICGAAFYFTDAGKILTGIDQACKDNANIDIREAALVSLVEYVTDFVADMMTIKSV